MIHIYKKKVSKIIIQIGFDILKVHIVKLGEIRLGFGFGAWRVKLQGIEDGIDKLWLAHDIRDECCNFKPEHWYPDRPISTSQFAKTAVLRRCSNIQNAPIGDSSITILLLELHRVTSSRCSWVEENHKMIILSMSLMFAFHHGPMGIKELTVLWSNVEFLGVVAD
ncbi:uncharacterized protein LOC131616243 [Vicia villosa]|uniref:uncharacterized protein LOC131616243 n=1 Tax=Vicia villosa TaxID=3911 RepID=UPI00273BCE1E|nr:uncharacterized protein LOC131616243 [Vicia villosa]